jgi:hypothetical protein
VSAIGTIPSSGVPGGPAVASYVLDTFPPVTFSANSSSATVFRKVFYQSPSLPDGQHQLVITNSKAGGELWLDYILYSPSALDSTSNPPSGMPSTTDQKTPRGPVGAFAAGIVGGTALIILLIVAGHFFYRRKKQQRVRVLNYEKSFISYPGLHSSPPLSSLSLLTSRTQKRVRL